MDFSLIEELLELPEFRVIDYKLVAKRLELHLERREAQLLCPKCGRLCSAATERREGRRSVAAMKRAIRRRCEETVAA